LSVRSVIAEKRAPDRLHFLDDQPTNQLLQVFHALLLAFGEASSRLRLRSKGCSGLCLPLLRFPGALKQLLNAESDQDAQPNRPCKAAEKATSYGAEAAAKGRDAYASGSTSRNRTGNGRTQHA
jgi:hypothetical protein